MNTHPSEKEIQQYALGEGTASREMTEHLASCAECSVQAETYRMLFAGMQQQPRPAFDFDLQALLMEQLHVATDPAPADRFVAGFLVVFIAASIGLPLVLFRQYLLNMLDGISTFFLYAIIGSAIVIISMKALKMYRTYRKQMQLLNFN